MIMMIIMMMMIMIMMMMMIMMMIMMMMMMMIMMLQVEANGENEHPIFTYLKKELPHPSDDPDSLMANPQLLIWKPIKRTDISWNFEKFLIGPDGSPLKR